MGFDEGLFPPATSTPPKEKGASGGSYFAYCGLSCSTVSLLVILCLVYLVIWTLPAPTLWSKVTLLRQSWHLSEVMKEPPLLQGQLAKAEEELKKLRNQVAEVDPSSCSGWNQQTASDVELRTV